MSTSAALNLTEPDKVEIEIAALTTCFVCAFIMLCIYCAWKVTCRSPLEFNMYIVEMYSMQNKRLVEVLHTGSNYDNTVPFSNQLAILRSRAVREFTEDGSLLRISETNVVIQAPSNVIHAAAQSNIINEQQDSLVLWDIEMPCSTFQPNPTREAESQIAAAAALTVLGKPRYHSSSLQTELRRRIPNAGNGSQPSSVVQMQYLQPIRRRGLAHLPLYRTPIALSLSREAIVTSEVSNTPSRMTSTTLSTFNGRNLGQSMQSESGSTNNEADSLPNEEANISDNLNNMDRYIRIRLKFLDDTHRVINTNLDITVLQFKKNNFPDDVREGKIIRLIFRGKLMRDDRSTLEACGWYNDCIVHAIISNTSYEQPEQQQNSTISSSLTHSNRGRSVNPDEQRSNVWLVAVFLSFLSSQITAFPVHIRTYFIELIVRHNNYLRPSDRNNVFSNAYRRAYNYINQQISSDPVETASIAAGSRSISIGNFLLWIFGGQCVLVWMFVYYFPQLCDRTAFGLLLLLTLYFFFVVVPMPNRRSLRQT